MAPKPQELKFFLLKSRVTETGSTPVLGRLVKNYLNPMGDYAPSRHPAEALTPDVWSGFLVGPQTDHDRHITAVASRDRSFWAKAFKGLASADAQDADDGSSEITSPKITVWGLKRETAYLEALKAVPEVRVEMLDLCPVGGKLYLVVGTMSFQAASVRRAGGRTTGAGVSAAVPGELVAAAAAAAGVAGLPGDGGAVVELGVNASSSAAWATAYAVKGAEGSGAEGGQEEEVNVFAVACKEVSRNLLGLGKDMKLRAKQPEYRGGMHCGGSDDESNEEKGLQSPPDRWDVDSCLFKFDQPA
ncbi:hypothetical protein RB595_003923 [Gaeumannomyces hyphopodioides]